jgi:hypothetical protein
MQFFVLLNSKVRVRHKMCHFIVVTVIVGILLYTVCILCANAGFTLAILSHLCQK